MITTYLTDYELELYSKVQDPALNEYFQEVRTKFGNRYHIQEYFIKTKKLFQKETQRTFYTLYFGNGAEVQIINFANDGEASINTGVSKSVLITYFLGLLNGAEYKNRFPDKHKERLYGEIEIRNLLKYIGKEEVRGVEYYFDQYFEKH